MIKILKCSGGWWAVLVWDPFRGDWCLWWSGSKNERDVLRVVRGLMNYKRG